MNFVSDTNQTSTNDDRKNKMNIKESSNNIKRLNEEGWRINQDEHGVLRWYNLFDKDYDESNLKVKYLTQDESELN